MEATIIRLDNVNTSSPMVVRSATFEEAFGDFSEARGRGRARRKKRKLERIENKREVRTARRKKKADRQTERIERRRTRKERRQEMRAQQQEARMGRRTRRMDMRQQRAEARNLRKMTKEQGDQERENYGMEQEAYRDSLSPQEEQGGSMGAEQGGGYSDEQGGSMGAEQGGSMGAEQGGSMGAEQGGGGYSNEQVGATEDWASAPQGYDAVEEELYDDTGYADDNGYGEDGGYGDDEMYDSPYVQEESEFADDSYFNLEGMDGKGAVVPPTVADNINKFKNNRRAYNDLNDRRVEMARVGNNTKGIDMRIQKCYGRMCELREQIENFVNADGNPNEKNRRRKAVGLALGLKKRPRPMNQGVGRGRGRGRGIGRGLAKSVVPVQKGLNPVFGKQRIVIPPKSSFDDEMSYFDEMSDFDAYSDLGRPVIVNGTTQSDYADYSNDLLTDSVEPTTIDLFSNADGSSSSGNTGKAVLSIAIGIGVGALAIYVAKRKGWI